MAKNKITILTLIIISVFFLSGCTADQKTIDEQVDAAPTLSFNNQKESKGDTMPEEKATTKKVIVKPEMQIVSKKTYTAVLSTTYGDITLKFFADKTPITVNNFVYLAEKGFYDNTIFHRVIKGFMIQGGDPEGTGSGGPGYRFNDEPFDGEYKKGTIAMANAGPNTNGSQFFIMHEDFDLPKNYVIFGEVTKGMDVVDKIATAPVTASAMGENSKPAEPVAIKTVEIKNK